MTRNMVQGLETILADDRLGVDEQLTDEVRSGLLFVICAFALIVTGVVLMLHAAGSSVAVIVLK